MAEIIRHTRSSYIAETTYDQDEQTLEVTFTDGARWRYLNVPRGIYTQFITSPSRGSAFHALIRDVYDAEPV